MNAVTPLPRKIPVAILGATGTVGQRFVQLLSSHPWFEVAALSSSTRSEGKRYGEACRWRLPGPIPEEIASMRIGGIEPGDLPLAFSALDAGTAAAIEPAWAAAGAAVFSNAATCRMDEDVPVLIPEVNGDHLGLLEIQKRKRATGKGFIVTNPNCSTTFLALALAPLQREFGLARASVVTMQAISGAGYPGVPAADILGNVIPFINREEEKIETETRKILGRFTGDAIENARVLISAQANRVPVADGHMESVSFELERSARIEDVREVLASFRGEPQTLGLPSAPNRPVIVLPEEDRPQPRLDLHREKGMAAVVGRLRPCPLFGYKMTILGHNTIRGAAGGAILNAELAYARRLLDISRPVSAGTSNTAIARGACA